MALTGGSLEDRRNSAFTALVGIVSGEGTQRHPFAGALIVSGADPRDLADAVHHLCLLHGRHPGVIDHAGTHTVHEGARGWLTAAAEAFAGERALLTRLVVAAGPLPSTPNHAEAEAAITTQRHALDMLSQSDRHGCAIGAAFALALDWAAIRAVLAAAGRRFGVEIGADPLPPSFETTIVASTLAEDQAIERAMMFGAQQMIAQHHGLWDLLEARAEARRHHP